MLIQEVKAVLWKEWRELFFKQSLRNQLRTLLLIVVIGVAMPLNKGAEWFDTSFFYGIGLTGPFLMVLTVICDLFAGERERHTLEILLASQISDQGFIMGKLSFAISYATAITILLLFLNIVTINMEYYHGTFNVFSLSTFLAIISINIIGAITGSILGALVALKASSVKQAQIGVSILLVVLIFSPALLAKALSAGFKNEIFKIYLGLGTSLVISLTTTVILIINLLLLLYIFRRYNRAAIL